MTVEDIDGKRTTRQLHEQATAALMRRMTQSFLDVQGEPQNQRRYQSIGK